jgi:hypothetical protein
VTPSAIGFPSSCPATAVPSGASCGGPIGDLQSLVACVDCIGTFDTAYLDRAQLPRLISYPDACNTCIAPPPSGPCPTSLTFEAHGPAVDLDTGWTGLAHTWERSSMTLAGPKRPFLTRAGSFAKTVP